MKIKVTRLFHGIEEDRDFSPGEILTTKECTEDRLKLFVEKEVAEAIEETPSEETPSEDAHAAEEPKKRTVARKKKTEE
ncbi:hypothetical protein HMPREF1635_02135 [Clostridiales bacterium S5-A14a]|nr:hypothetical protein HMPREF1635_02135 [Clostridiales bacterium S5-A14a]